MNGDRDRAVIQFGHVRLLSDPGKRVAAPSGGGGGSQGSGKGQGGGVGTGKGQGAVHGRGEGLSSAVLGVGQLVTTLAAIGGASVPPPSPPSASAYQRAVLADTPFLYWKLDEPSGTVAADTSVNSHPGTIVNTPALGQTPLISTGKACRYTAASSQYTWYSVGGGLPNPGQSVLSVECWIKTTQSGGGFPAIVGAANANASQQAFLLRLNASNAIEAVWWSSGGASFVHDGSTVVNGGGAHHVVMTQDGTKSHIYIDAVEDGAGSAYSASPTVGTLWEFGVATRFHFGVAAEFFDGTVDEVAIYNTVLSPARVAAHYAARSS